MPPTEEPQSSARDRILTVASGLFAEGGFDAVSVADIAQASGISTGLIYYHFTDKQTLYETSVWESVHLLEEVAVHALAAEDATPADRLRQFALDYMGLVDQHSDLVRMLVRAWDLQGPVPKLLLARSAAVIDRIQAVIDEGVAAGTLETPNPRLAAVALFALVNTPVTARTLEAPIDEKSALPPAKQAEFMVDLFLKGISPCS